MCREWGNFEILRIFVLNVNAYPDLDIPNNDLLDKLNGRVHKNVLCLKSIEIKLLGLRIPDSRCNLHIPQTSRMQIPNTMRSVKITKKFCKKAARVCRTRYVFQWTNFVHIPPLNRTGQCGAAKWTFKKLCKTLERDKNTSYSVAQELNGTKPE